MAVAQSQGGVGLTMRKWKTASSASKTFAVDPYLMWARDTAFRYSSGINQTSGTFYSVIIECKVSAAALWAWANPRGPRAWIAIPFEYKSIRFDLGRATFCTAQIRRDKLELLLKKNVAGFWHHVVRFELAANVSPNKIDPKTIPVPIIQSGRPAVVAGVIDIGIPFAHRDYRSRLPLPGRCTINRMLAMWDQSYGKLGGTASPTFGYGREWSESFVAPPLSTFTMSELLTGVSDVSSEERLYRSLSIDIADRSNSHGAAVLGEIAGTRSFAARKSLTDAAATTPILAVQLPRATIGYSARASLAVHILDGLRWMLSRIGTMDQLVVNVSLGTHAGPHDGSSILERAIDELIKLTSFKRPHVERLAVVLAAGNSREARSHAKFDLSTKAKSIQFRVLPDDITPSFIEIWLPLNADVTVALISPSNVASTANERNDSQVLENAAGHVLAAIYRPENIANGNGQMILVAIAPTVEGYAEHGIYKLVLTANRAVKNVHAWIERDNSMYDLNRPRGRQSYFVDEQYIPSGRDHKPPPATKSFIERETTLNSYATGKRTVVVGAFDASRGRVAIDSSAGPVRNSRGVLAPIAAGVSEESLWVEGQRVAGTRSGDVSRLRGTSIAAPKVARLLLNQRAAGNRAPTAREIVEALARASENAVSPHWEAKPGQNLAGYGRISVKRLA